MGGFLLGAPGLVDSVTVVGVGFGGDDEVGDDFEVLVFGVLLRLLHIIVSSELRTSHFRGSNSTTLNSNTHSLYPPPPTVSPPTMAPTAPPTAPI